jgi:hypothetical protein
MVTEFLRLRCARLEKAIQAKLEKAEDLMEIYMYIYIYIYAIQLRDAQEFAERTLATQMAKQGGSRAWLSELSSPVERR